MIKEYIGLSGVTKHHIICDNCNDFANVDKWSSGAFSLPGNWTKELIKNSAPFWGYTEKHYCERCNK